MRHNALAKKCLAHVRGMTRKSPRSNQSCSTVHTPTVATVNKPTHLQDRTAPSERPVKTSHVHQRSVKGSCLSSFENPTNRNIVSAVKNTNGESRRICRDWVTKPFSKVKKSVASREVVALQSRARSVK